MVRAFPTHVAALKKHRYAARDASCQSFELPEVRDSAASAPSEWYLMVEELNRV